MLALTIIAFADTRAAMELGNCLLTYTEMPAVLSINVGAISFSRERLPQGYDRRTLRFL